MEPIAAQPASYPLTASSVEARVEHEAEYAAFVTERWSTLVRAAVFLGAAAHEAEDLVQATLLLCYRKWDRVRDADDRDGYVFRMLLNVLRTERRSAWWRHRSPHGLASTPEVAVPDAAELTATADAVHRAMRTLSREQREVVVLRYFVELSEAQTAAVLGIRPGTVKSRLSRSLARLSADHHLSEFAGGVS
jgi:RNA polymerase sigma-70 factor (sigma-E family)